MIRVILESPAHGDTLADRERNQRYARACMLDCLRRGEAPFVSHLLYAQVLDDEKPEERELGIDAGLEWGPAAYKCVVYVDLGVSPGMKAGIANAKRNCIPVKKRSLEGWSA
jgi:hypothetical protein